eukprot:CAMPEP_0204612212 /NCGR_PEP_ID=MMETSP0717-20131115/319_1 /ASSEMBLY_ACC=CAM_ASM_000666 /TAXON_ID=230516 /ORGANISM="Chaetoceros curvisetus" /LENGTH=365 /DNA_ID=CAMNT_0051624205 /DNA_START=27 /DNA_END=1124 /DNA_ORIENTATION=-
MSNKSNLTANVKLQWTKVVPSPDPDHPTGTPCARSSHGVSWISGSNSLIVYGGEHIARTPLETSDASWACHFDAEGGCQWRAIVPDNAPSPRIAHAQAVHEATSTIYVFGGRAGITMKEMAMNDLWKLDCSGGPGSETWSEVIPADSSTIPEARSFHKMLCVGDNLYVFGGCGDTSGRLKDLHRFDLKSLTWHSLGESQHLRGRGGPTFLSLNSGRALGVVAGFAGEETNDGHVFDIFQGSNKWAETPLNDDLKDMRPRSVCIGGSFPKAGVSIVFGGEVDPSAKGHEGAGGFENDIVLLDETSGRYLDTIPHDDVEPCPETRGWSDGAVAEDSIGGTLFVFGGLSGDDTTPKRLDDLWKLQVSK